MFNNELWQKPTAAGATGIYPYQIANSLRLNGTSQALERSFSSTPSNADAKALSFWIKRSGAGGTNSAFGSTTNTKLCSSSTGSGAVADMLEINTNNPTGYSDQFHYYLASGGANFLKAKWRDPSAWIHIVWIYNSDESTTTDRIKVYINGESNTINDSNYWDNDGNNGYPSSGADTSFGLNGNEMHIGRYVYDDAGWWGGQMADFIMIDGTASISDFGETHNGIWRPKDPSGLTFGTNGFWLKFTNASNPGEDFSGNDNDFTNIGSIATHDQMLDSPTFNSDSNGGNFATMNPLISGSSSPVLAEGNLMMDSFSGSDISGSLANFALPASSGKWYFECFINSPNSGDNYPFIGLTATTYSQSATMGVSQRDLSINLGTGGSEKNETYVGSITTDFTSVSAYADNTICGVFVDMDARKLWYAKDGAFTNSGNPQNGTNPNYAWTNNVPLLPHFVSFSSYGADSVLNFGQDGTFAGNVTAGGNSDVTGYGNFKYDPGDYKALCAGNLPVADAVDPAQTDDDYPQKLFTALAYSGDGGGSFTTGFQPDLVWVKRRNGSQGNGLWDSSRGTTKVLNSDSTSAEATSSGLTSFNSTGYTMGNFYNQSGNTYASWSWRANGGTTSSETAGSINTTVQVNQNAGFSIVQYVGDGGSSNCTMAHGLGAKPAMVFLKDRDTNGNNNQWQAWHHKLDTNGYFYLSSNDQQYTSSNGTVNVSANTTNLIGWQRTSTTGGSQTISESGDNFLMYIWAEIEGFSKFGSYKGNGNADGTFVYTGFRPALVTTKRTDGSGGWLVHDDARNTGNPANLIVQWNDSGAEFSGANDKIDMLSNGFKVRSSNAGINGSGNDYVYAAWAHNPFKYATAR